MREIRHRPQTQFIPFCLLILLATGCVSRTAANLNSPTANVQRGVKPSSLSEYIRGVYKLSSEASKHAEQRAALIASAPQLQSLVDQVDLDPSDLDARSRLVSEYMSREFHWAAYELLTEALATNPYDPDNNLDLAVIWDAWGQYNLALQYGDRAVANGAASQRAFVTLGRIQLHRNEPTEAVAWYSRALEDRRTASVLVNLGYAQMLKTDWTSARRSLEEAVELDSTLEEAHNNLAIVLSKTGDDKGALAHLMQTARPAVALNNMGVLYLAEKKVFDAQHSFEEALRIEPDYEMARQNLTALEALLPPPAIIRLPAFTNEPARSRETAEIHFDDRPVAAVDPIQGSQQEDPTANAQLEAPEIEDPVVPVASAWPVTETPLEEGINVPATHERHGVIQTYGGQNLRMAGFAGLMVVTGLFALRSRKATTGSPRY